MRILLNGSEQKTVYGGSVSITNSMTDPVPTCALTLDDQNSALSLPPFAELLILDDQVIPNPTINYIIRSHLNPYNGSFWTVTTNTGITLSQIVGGGVNITVSNAAANTYTCLTQNLFALFSPIAGKTYTCSFFVQGASSPTNVGAYVELDWIDAAGNSTASTFFGPIPASTSLTRYSFTTTAPANVATATLKIGVKTTSGTNSGVVSFTQLQLEPQWFSDMVYPTPYCGPSQANCVALATAATPGIYIRQYRKFAGAVLTVDNDNYRGNIRDVTVQAVGYAWLFSTMLTTSNTYTNQFDSDIITNIIQSQLLLGIFDLSNVIPGAQLSNFGVDYTQCRGVFDTLASQSGFYWTVDNYWRFVYASPGYFTMPIALICDNSAIPDNVTTFPAYGFGARSDFSQPGNNILVIGSGTNVAQVADPTQMAANMVRFAGGLPSFDLKYFIRKISESGLQSITDCTNRGIAELLQYNFPRASYRLTANVELLAGQGIRVTSNTDGLSNTTLLIQSVTATWKSKDNTLHDFWEYKAELGTVNRAVTNILTRLARQASGDQGLPAAPTVSLVAVEQIGMQDSINTSAATTGYVQTIQADGPLAYYRLNELSGTIADDFSGHAQQGTLNGGITLGATGLLFSGGDTAMSFNGSSGYIQLPNTGTWPTGNTAWSLECWCKPTNSTNASNGHLIMIGNPGTNAAAASICQTSTGGWGVVTWGGAGHDFQGNGTSTGSTIYHIVATYDGASNLRLYVNNVAFGAFNPGTLNLTSQKQSIGDTWNGSSQGFFFNGVIDEVAIYGYQLSSGQVSTHYTAGTT